MVSRPAGLLVESLLGSSCRRARSIRAGSVSAHASRYATSTRSDLAGLRIAGLAISRRHLSSSIGRYGIFGSSSTSSTNAAASAPSQASSNEHDSPLTPFQTQIAALETEALGNPEDLEKQTKLLRALMEGGEYVGIAKYYEAMALTSEGHGSKALLESGEALDLYLEALGKVGRMREVAGVVRRRDALRNASPLAAASAPTPPAPTTATSTPSSTVSASTPSSILSGSISPSGSPQPEAANGGASTLTGTQPGTPLAPIYVQMAPATPQMSAMRAVRWLLGMLFWAFIILTILSMVMENTGLLKAGPGPAEFEPEEGKVVKFSDVHGVEEAKDVRHTPRSHHVVSVADVNRNSKRSSNS